MAPLPATGKLTTPSRLFTENCLFLRGELEVIAMSRRTLSGLSKANLPQWIWACLPFWVGSLIWALDGKTPDWGIISLFIVTVIIIQASAELANTYVDRKEDHIFVPSNPLVTGELTVN